VPVLSTPFGARGLDLEDREHAWLAPLDEFPVVIPKIMDMSATTLKAMVRRARDHAVRLFAWEVVAEHLTSALSQLCLARTQA